MQGCRRTLIAAPALAAALIATGGAAANASTPPGGCCYPRLRLQPPALGTRTLRRGSSGSAVESLQNLLNHARALKSSNGKWCTPSPLKEDGKFGIGSGTESRVRGAQRAAGLNLDGVVGAATHRAAIRACENGDIG